MATLVPAIQYKRAGNIIHQQEISCDVYQEDDHYSLVPLRNSNGLAIANLPPGVSFVMQDGKPVSLRGKKTETFT